MTILCDGITLYLIRHGETEWNREQRYQGQRDIPLNAHGRLQAARNGEMLKQTIADIGAFDFVSSPLSRAVETMHILRSTMGLDPDGFRLDPDLRELNYGTWEGHLATTLPDLDPDGVRAKRRDPFGWRPQGGESYADLSDRITAWIASLDKSTVAVTHGGVSRVACGCLAGVNACSVPYLEIPQDRILRLGNGTMEWL